MTESSSTTALLPRTSADHQVVFSDFFDCWLAQQDRDLQSLHAAAAAASIAQQHQHNKHQGADHQTAQLVGQVMGHYEYYYRAKSALARRDVLPMFTPTWTSSTENLFIWVGGWRPSTAFHILHSKSGLQFESHLADLALGVSAEQDLGMISHGQLERIDQQQRETVRLEKEISEEEAQAQESVASAQLVHISHTITEAMRRSIEDGGLMEKDGGLVESAMDADMKERREKMMKVLNRADQLRLDTLKAVVEILRPMQAVHFLIAVSELLLRVHEFGKSKDSAARVRSLRRNRSSEM